MSRLLAPAGWAGCPSRREAAREEPDLDGTGQEQARSSLALREPPWVRGHEHRAGSSVSGLFYLNVGGV